MDKRNELNTLKELMDESKEKQGVIIGIALLTAVAYAVFVMPFTTGIAGISNGFIGMFFFFGFEIIIAGILLFQLQQEIDELKERMNKFVDEL